MKKLCILFLLLCSINVWSDLDWLSMLDEPVVVSLGRCMYRYKETARLMEEAGFTNIQRLEAIDGENTDDAFFKGLNIIGGLNGQKGCAASHLLLWKDFAENPSVKEYLFVCEDDMLPHSHFPSIFPLYWEATPKDFDIVMVGNWFQHLFGLGIPNFNLIVRIPTLTTHAYIISKKGARKLFNLYQRRRGGGGFIDNFIQDMMRQNQIIYYCYNGKRFPDAENKAKGIIKFGTGICFQNRRLNSTISPSKGK